MTSSCNSKMAAKKHLQCSYLRNQRSDRRHFNAYCTISIKTYHWDHIIWIRIDDVIMQYQDGCQGTFTMHISQEPSFQSTSFQRFLYYIDHNLWLGSRYKDKNWWLHHAIPRWPPKNTWGNFSKTPETSVRPQEESVGPQETSVVLKRPW